ncbi:hypothetical protein [Actinotalea fermentans]|uniref:Uncharacterized protein n=1 Tax=Actinotalea fermentans TaxID=43671 RepID=A0A511Z0J5_9CELL|nr:hypothetical protein [Actinotalea fermentans]KGM15829.1 hypothetical protein N867_05115 [Actinotalea fermentans ATCC 43279 = JCM 9966 = DSM 3133]GEN80896.1 hypothetical protein AFE02nite_26300 [Actinotalea fermentans]
MNEIKVNIDTVQSNVKALNGMFDQLESGVQGVKAVQGLQTTTTWTDIPSCQQFAAAYQAGLVRLQQRLNTTWQNIRDQAEALRDAAAALAATDEASQQELAQMQTSLDALLARAARGPEAVAPVPSGPMRAI